MASVTKNPMILQSCNYIYNWFLTKIETDEKNKTFNMLEMVESDKYTMNNIKKNYSKKELYNDIDYRIKKANGEIVEDY
ncbi:hypothetical protein [Cetobacterium sp.]|uniref:hypothetical protein n=1 Tax=Cetobacterium sp. TaxID=2071632 RepID=UPI003F2B661E